MTMTTIKLSGGCQSPVTEEVHGRHTRLGPLDLLAYRKHRRWRWTVALDGEVLVEGRARNQEAAVRAVEAAGYRCYEAVMAEEA